MLPFQPFQQSTFSAPLHFWPAPSEFGFVGQMIDEVNQHTHQENLCSPIGQLHFRRSSKTFQKSKQNQNLESFKTYLVNWCILAIHSIKHNIMQVTQISTQNCLTKMVQKRKQFTRIRKPFPAISVRAKD